MRAGAVGLLERIGPTAVLTHSFGGGSMLEKNNAEIAALRTDWIIKHA